MIVPAPTAGTGRVSQISIAGRTSTCEGDYYHECHEEADYEQDHVPRSRCLTKGRRKRKRVASQRVVAQANREQQRGTAVGFNRGDADTSRGLVGSHAGTVGGGYL